MNKDLPAQPPAALVLQVIGIFTQGTAEMQTFLKFNLFLGYFSGLLI